MFITPTKKILVLGSILGIGGLGLYGGNELSKKTIQDALGDEKIVEEEIVENNHSGAWSVLTWKIKDSNYPDDSEKSKIKSFDFKNLEINGNDVESFRKLKEKCKESVNSKYSDLFTRNKDLMDDVKNFCFLSVGEMLMGMKLFDVLGSSYLQSDKDDLRKNLSKIDNVSEAGEIRKSELLEMKNKFSLDSNNPEYEKSFQLLFEFCKKEYSNPYLGDESIPLKNLIGKYCVKEKNQVDNSVLT